MKKLVIIILVALPIITYKFAFSLQGEEVRIEATYLQLACEKCYHMEVISSSNEELIGKTIIPTSSVLNIENILANNLTPTSKVCLKGKPYLWNPNWGNIDPDGIRFNVISQCN
ncbi:hypothetical protein [Hahella sp. HN01]|uniref:hypothetical protein n=1 Tax=Hahella sp. HN01 TaxID=2847262 RepID=UPI001C1F18AE|nr:hypothetical protein [Hahella sp. HN01]MBU6952467.1 hypothetical protein [Hahella sp. HN01]